MNGTGNMKDIGAKSVPAIRTKLNPAKTVQKLLAIRRKHGADSAAGRHCSNLDEIYQNKRKTTDPETLKNLDANEALQWAGLNRALLEQSAGA